MNALRLGGPYFQENGDCPYLPGKQWAADYLITRGRIDARPQHDLKLEHNSFEGDTPPLLDAIEPPGPAGDSLDIFNHLLANGFRRAGRLFYHTACQGCSECVSLRVDVERFVPSGDQRRALRKNRDVEVVVGFPEFTQEKFDVYAAFIRERYAREEATMAGYESFFTSHLGNTREFRYFVDHRLVGLGFVDLVREAASSVYFFFDPAHASRSLGTYSVLREIDFCRQTGRRYLYLGFWVADCKAMTYKSKFHPHHLLGESGWQ